MLAPMPVSAISANLTDGWEALLPVAKGMDGLLPVADANEALLPVADAMDSFFSDCIFSGDCVFVEIFSRCTVRRDCVLEASTLEGDPPVVDTDLRLDPTLAKSL